MSDEWDDWGNEEGTPTPKPSSVTSCRPLEGERQIAHIVQRLKDFQLNICDARTYETLNANAHARRQFDMCAGYYSSHSGKLLHQTLMDIQRMPYTLTHTPAYSLTGGDANHTTSTTTDTRAIQTLCEAAMEAAHDASTSTPESPHSPSQRSRQSLAPLALLWAMANQSIYGDVLTFLRPFLQADLFIGISNADTVYSVDTSALTLKTSCLLVFSSTILNDKGGIAKLPLASIQAHVAVSIAQKAIHYTLSSPILAPCFDDQLAQAAVSIIRISGADGDDDEVEADAYLEQLLGMMRKAGVGRGGSRETEGGDEDPHISGPSIELGDALRQVAQRGEEVLEAGITGMVRGLGLLVGAGSEEGPISFRREEGSREGNGKGKDVRVLFDAVSSGAGRSSSRSTSSVPTNYAYENNGTNTTAPAPAPTLNTTPAPAPARDVGRLFDPVADTSSSKGGGWGWVSASLVRGLGAMVGAEGVDEDEGLALYRRGEIDGRGEGMGPNVSSASRVAAVMPTGSTPDRNPTPNPGPFVIEAAVSAQARTPAAVIVPAAAILPAIAAVTPAVAPAPEPEPAAVPSIAVAAPESEPTPLPAPTSQAQLVPSVTPAAPTVPLVPAPDAAPTLTPTPDAPAPTPTPISLRTRPKR